MLFKIHRHRKISLSLFACLMAALVFNPFRANGQLFSLLQPVRVSWAASDDSSVVGYNLYFGDLSDDNPIKLNVGKSLNFTLPNLFLGTTYFFYVTAYNAKGVESDPTEIKVYTPAVKGPDLVVTSALYSPIILTDGDRVQFRVALRNQGNVGIPQGTSIRLTFLVNGQAKAGWVDYAGGLNPGESVNLLAGEGSFGTGTWIAKAGFQTITVMADYLQAVSESNEANNQFVMGALVLPRLTLPWLRPEEEAPEVLPDDGSSLVANPDSDGDGMTDWAEFQAGTDPNFAASVLKFQSFEPGAGNHVILRWQSVPGITYQIMGSDSLSENGWKPASAPVTATESSTEVSVPKESDSGFFSIRVISAQEQEEMPASGK